MRRLSAVLPLLLLVACSGDDDDGPATPDAGFDDAGREPDGGDRDGGSRDGGFVDGGFPDGGRPDGGVPELDVRIPGLTGAVTVTRDAWGILHVACASDVDCFAVQGYFHAADRFGQMDIRRRAGTGRLAEVFGPLLLDTDKAARHFVATSTGASLADRLWASASPASRAMAEAYARGVNAWIDDLRNDANGAALAPEYRPYERWITPWTPLDSVACILPLIENLTNQSGSEISRGERFARLPPDQALDLLGLEPASKSSVLERVDFGPVGLDHERRRAAARDIQARLAHTTDLLASATLPRRVLGELDGFGSNNWAVAGSHTANGSTLFASDPHLGLSQPAVWYLVNIHGESVHAAGASFPGLPGVIFGQNEDVAWGSTTTLFDLADVYVETLDSTGDAVMFEGNAVPILEVPHTFSMVGGADVTETFRYVPHHGPVVAYDAAMGMALTVRWTGAEVSTDANFIWGMMTATNVDEARAVLESVTTLGQNWVVVDRGGSIGWFPYNRVPRRPWASALLPPWLPLPGDGSAEWQGFVPYAELPQATDPPSGFIATANNDMTGALADGDPTNDGQAALQHFVAEGFRHERIVERLAAGGAGHSVASMQALQADIYSLLGAKTTARIVALGTAGMADLSPGGAAALDALAAWDFECPTGIDGDDPSAPKTADPAVAASSIGCTVFHLVWWRMFRQAFGDELGAAGVSPVATDGAGYRLLMEPSRLIGGASYWDDINSLEVETSTIVAVTALNNTALWLGANVGPNADDWRWGRIHTMTLLADIFSNVSPLYDHGPFCSDGGLYTVDVANPGGRYRDEYEHLSGASMRVVCEASAAAMSCAAELTGGQSASPSSPHYDDLLLRTLSDQPVPLPFTPAEVDAAAQETVVIRPPR